MPTINDLIASIEVELEAAQKRASKHLKEAELILATAQKEGRSNLTEEEGARVEELRDLRTKVRAEIKGIQAKLDNAREVQTEEADSERQRSESVKETGARKPAYDQVARVGSEERTYSREKDAHGVMFFRDVVRQHLFQDPESSMRLSRHAQEERVERAQKISRAVGTSGFEGLVVPQYLTDMYAPATAALRPFADVCNGHPLPESGMSVEISRITTATDVDIQASQNTNVAEQDIDDTLLSIPVRTAAGRQTVSRQAIDRGTGIESVVIQDLFNRYATRLDNTLLNVASVGLSAASTPVTYTDASPSAMDLYPKILEAAAGSEAALLQMATPTHAVMHSRRWYWLQSQLSEKWPLIAQPQVPVQTAGSNAGVAYGTGIRGVLPNGLQVVVDNNVATNGGTGTNQDEVYVVPAAEAHLWEDPDAPLFIRSETAKAESLGVVLVLYGYFAFTFGRYPGGMQKVAGTGLVTPDFGPSDS